MHETARTLRSALVAILAGTLLAFALPCASVCAAIPAIQTDDADSHCARSASTEQPAPDLPCDDDCAGCSVSGSQVSIPSTVSALDASPGHGFVVTASRFVSFETGVQSGAPPGRHFTEDPPRRDVRSLTTTLLI